MFPGVFSKWQGFFIQASITVPINYLTISFSLLTVMPFLFSSRLSLLLASFFSSVKLKFIASFWFMAKTVCILFYFSTRKERNTQKGKCPYLKIREHLYKLLHMFPIPPSLLRELLKDLDEFICYTMKIKWKCQLRNCFKFFIRDSWWDGRLFPSSLLFQALFMWLSMYLPFQLHHNDCCTKAIKQVLIFRFASFLTAETKERNISKHM